MNVLPHNVQQTHIMQNSSQITNTQFLQTRCPSCHSTNSVKALKAWTLPHNLEIQC